MKMKTLMAMFMAITLFGCGCQNTSSIRISAYLTGMNDGLKITYECMLSDSDCDFERLAKEKMAQFIKQHK